MQWGQMASITLGATGDPVAFFRNGLKVHDSRGVYRNSQELKRSRNKSMRLIDCDVITIPYSSLVKSGDSVTISDMSFRVAGNPKRDGSGGMVVKLETESAEKTNLDRFNR
ncbi:head-closure protein [Vibrio phage 1.111.B._10N.286.45.E6]|nr:head-closure protein [Vibrio phage 1.111.A._10N.286.45.E6]AUR88273.1 head-closure protein [Vibrio phage 1.111.B._10N.286.45.E6]